MAASGANGTGPGHGSDTRPHVVALIDSLDTGGAERLAVEIAARLDPARFRSTMCLTRSPEQMDVDPAVQASAERRLREAGVRMIVLDRTRTFDLAAWRPLIALLRRDPPAVIHGHMFGSNVWATLLGRLYGVPTVVIHNHGQADLLRPPIVALLTRHLLARASAAAIGVSSETGRHMIDRDGFDAARVHVILNGVPAVDGADGARIRTELSIGRDDPVVVSVTLLRPAKNVDVLIEAAAALRSRYPRLRVLIAGDGPERPRLESLIRDLGVEDAVTLLGIRRDVPDLLDAADVAVLASQIEGAPLAVMEYMEARVPIVATRVGGIPELLEDGVHGLLIEPGAPASLAAAIAGLLEDPTGGRRLADAAYERKSSMFDIARVVERIEELYDQLLLSTSAGPRTGR